MERRALVVDDEPVILEVLAELLEEDGFSVATAADGKSALALVTSESFGVAVIDKNLPGDVDGLAILRELRQRAPLTRVIIHTGYSSTASAIEALRQGAFDYIVKPTDNLLLVERIKRAWESYAVEIAHTELFATYDALFDVIPGVVWFRTEAGLLSRISHRGANLLGYDTDELVGSSYEVLLDADSADGAAHWAFKERRSGGRATRRLPVTLRTKAGEKRVFEISSAAAYDVIDGATDPGHRGTLGVGWDITDQCNLLAELQQSNKMDALGRLAGGVAHDLNNILSVVAASVEFARDAATITEAERDLQEIELATERAAALTRQLLLFSRNETVTPKPIRLGEVLKTVQGMLTRLLPADIDLEVDTAADLGIIKADRGQLEQIVVNLVVNARDSMADGGRLSISARNISVEEEYADAVPNLWPGEFVMLAVSDSGQGMTREAREHLFEPFFTTKKAGEGTGLGMSIVYGIVRQASGYINVYSELGLGTTIKIYLPRIVEEPDSQRPGPSHQRYLGSETVLLAEDDDAVRRIARRILEESGYRVVEAANGAIALAAWKAVDHVDLLLTDAVMPELSGPKLALELRRMQPDLPVVYMSGYLGALAQRERMLTDRAVFVAKPFTAAQLLQSIRELLDAAC